VVNDLAELKQSIAELRGMQPASEDLHRAHAQPVAADASRLELVVSDLSELKQAVASLRLTGVRSDAQQTVNDQPDLTQVVGDIGDIKRAVAGLSQLQQAAVDLSELRRAVADLSHRNEDGKGAQTASRVVLMEQGTQTDSSGDLPLVDRERVNAVLADSAAGPAVQQVGLC